MLQNGDIQITWEKVIDPTGTFVSYEIYQVTSSTSTLVQSISNINQESFIHNTVNGHINSFSYIIITTSFPAAINTPDTISSIKLTVNNPNNGLAILNWNKIFSPINSPSASNWYKIYQEYPLGTWTLIDSTMYGNEFYRDTITICNDTVNYRVTNSNANCISISSVNGGNFKDVLPPKIPVIKNVSVDTGTNTATISWNTGFPFDTDAYIILKFIGGAWIPIDTVWGINNTTYNYLLSQAGTTSECYGVAAFDSCWYGIPLSPNTSAMGTSHCSIFLQSTYNTCDKTVDLTWNAYTNWGAGVLRYEIYQEINGNTPILVGNTTSITYQVTNILSDSNYCFTIRAISNATDTAISNKTCLKTTYPFISDTNYLQTATVINENSIEVRIYTPIYNRIKGYNIERSTDGINYNYIGYKSLSPGPITYLDNNVKTKESSYHYRVIAVDSCSNQTTKVSNFAKSILLNTENQGYNILLRWNIYNQWDGAVKEYNIYRKLGTNVPSLIATVPAGSIQYTDDISNFYASSNDGKFCYYVEAVENNNRFSFSETSKSNLSCATPQELIYIPNAFSPNDDGVNDTFYPTIGFANYNTYSLQIFNRMGHLIYETNSITSGWDGRHKNKTAQNGIFIYQIFIENSEGKLLQRSGTVLLNR